MHAIIACELSPDCDHECFEQENQRTMELFWNQEFVWVHAQHLEAFCRTP